MISPGVRLGKSPSWIGETRHHDAIEFMDGGPVLFMSKSLLKLQIGPVQESIAQARSTRDLWSGSYLLSWLMAAGISSHP